jgi:phage portal protein BeeE
MGLFDLFKKKGLNPAVQFPVSLNGGATVAKFARQTSIEDSYASNADVYAIVALLARKAASIPWYVYRKKTDKGAGLALERYKQASRHPMDMATLKAYRAKSLDDSEVVMDSPLGQILTRPNATQGQDKFFETLYTYYWLTGEGFLWGNNGGIEGDRAPFV